MSLVKTMVVVGVSTPDVSTVHSDDSIYVQTQHNNMIQLLWVTLV